MNREGKRRIHLDARWGRGCPRWKPVAGEASLIVHDALELELTVLVGDDPLAPLEIRRGAFPLACVDDRRMFDANKRSWRKHG